MKLWYNHSNIQMEYMVKMFLVCFGVWSELYSKQTWLCIDKWIGTKYEFEYEYRKKFYIPQSSMCFKKPPKTYTVLWTFTCNQGHLLLVNCTVWLLEYSHINWFVHFIQTCVFVANMHRFVIIDTISFTFTNIFFLVKMTTNSMMVPYYM